MDRLCKPDVPLSATGSWTPTSPLSLLRSKGSSEFELPSHIGCQGHDERPVAAVELRVSVSYLHYLFHELPLVLVQRSEELHLTTFRLDLVEIVLALLEPALQLALILFRVCRVDVRRFKHHEELFDLSLFQHVLEVEQRAALIEKDRRSRGAYHQSLSVCRGRCLQHCVLV